MAKCMQYVLLNFAINVFMNVCANWTDKVCLWLYKYINLFDGLDSETANIQEICL
jgi:hypothetical protein